MAKADPTATPLLEIGGDILGLDWAMSLYSSAAGPGLTSTSIAVPSGGAIAAQRPMGT
jgi:hypothetical protein